MQFLQSARRLDMRGVGSALQQAAQINYAKVRGTYVDRPAVKATPYRRPPERTG